jgi:hypothetical protein
MPGYHEQSGASPEKLYFVGMGFLGGPTAHEYRTSDGEAIASEHGPKVSESMKRLWDLTDEELHDAILSAKMAGRAIAYATLCDERDSRSKRVTRGEN